MISTHFLSRLRHYFLCRKGVHSAGSFCAYCGKRLVDAPFMPYRVRSLDGQLDTIVDAISNEHAVRQFRNRYPRNQLIAQRLPAQDQQ